ncbi:MAG: (5-formylfuran-3-yl)methyl phosphate synthase [Fuerstia sp.]|nr:(5-formylfuran-3-yl)methyl phosphate synthase [Fuerstiella sp.]
MTQLLVSVRNALEAIAAVEGGADIIDVKEPIRGSLGCATPEVILAVADAVRSINGPQRPLSLALGELHEWQSDDLAALRNAIQTSSPQYLKLGLAGVCTLAVTSSWIAEWQRVRSSIVGAHEWVAVAYADHQQAGAPAVDLVLQAAIEAGCRILLIDTHTKTGMSLLDHLSLDVLRTIRRQTTQQGLKLALAGSIAKSDLPLVLPLQPDIIAVRGAVCEHGNRTATVSRHLVQGFRNAMNHGQRSDESV